MNWKKRWYIWVPAVLLSLFLVWYFFNIIIYIFIAAVLSLLGQPVVKFLDKLKIGKFKIPHVINAILGLLILMGTVLAIFGLLIPVIASQATVIGEVNVYALMDSFREPIMSFELWLRQYNLLPEGQSIEAVISERVMSVVEVANVEDIFGYLVGFAGKLSVGFFATMFITFFFLKDERMFYNGVMLFTPIEYQDEIQRILSYSKRMLTRYFLGLVLDLTIVISLISIGMHFIGLENALIIGFVAGIFNVIPYVGPIIGGAIGVLLGMTTLQGADFATESFPLIMKMLGVFVTVNLIDAFLLQPNIYANSVKAHPLEIFLVILMASSIAGVPGMILAIPGYTFIRIIAREFLGGLRVVRTITDKLGKELAEEKKE